MNEPIEPKPDKSFDAIGWETYALLGTVAAVAIVGAAALFLDIPGWLRGDTDLFGNYRYDQKIEQRRRQFTPLERVHAELFPGWLVAHASGRDGRRSQRPEEAYRTLRSKVSDDKLRSVLADLHALVGADDLLGRRGELTELMDRWNGRLEEIDEPFFVRLRATRRGGRSFAYGAFYRRIAQPAARVGDRSYEALLLRRIDNTNLYESFLGLTREDASYAFVVTDRVLDFAVRDVLPVVAAGSDGADGDDVPFSGPPELDAISESFEARVREALRDGLAEETYGSLERAARARVRLDRAVESIRSRRTCNNFRIAEAPWNGYRARTLDRLDGLASRDELRSCPAVEYDEADAIRSASEILRTDASERAFETTLAQLSRVIAIHEIRHRADHDAERPARSCDRCPDAMAEETRSELSAYTASFAWSKRPSLALFQACRSRPSGAHRRALGFFLDELGTLCDGDIPANLGERAREIESELFGTSEPIELSDEFPERLDLRIW